MGKIVSVAREQAHQILGARAVVQEEREPRRAREAEVQRKVLELQLFARKLPPARGRGREVVGSIGQRERRITFLSSA